MRELKQKTPKMTAAAREEAKRRRRETSPVRHLSSVWKEAMVNRFGVGVTVFPWGGKESSLVAKLLKLCGGVDRVEKMIVRFVGGWKNDADMPSVGLMWVLREKLVNQIDGKVESAEARIAAGEYNAEVAAEDAAEGWGEAFGGEVEPVVITDDPLFPAASIGEEESDEPKRRKYRKRGGGEAE